MSAVNSCFTCSQFNKWHPSNALIVASTVTAVILGLLAILNLAGLYTLGAANTFVACGALSAGGITHLLLIKKYFTYPKSKPQESREELGQVPSNTEQDNPRETVRKIWTEKYPITPTVSKEDETKESREELGQVSSNTVQDNPKETVRKIWTEKYPITPTVSKEDETKENREGKDTIMPEPTQENVIERYPEDQMDRAVLNPPNEDLKETVRRAWAEKHFNTIDIQAPPPKMRQTRKEIVSKKLVSTAKKKKLEENVLQVDRGAHKVELAVQQDKVSLYCTKLGSHLEILLDKLKKTVEIGCQTQEQFMLRLEQEVHLRLGIYKISKYDRPSELSQQLHAHLNRIREEAESYLSVDSSLLPLDIYAHLDYGLSPIKSDLAHLILMDQEITSGSDGGTSEYEGSKLCLDYLINFLISKNSCQYIHKTVYPIAENLSYFLKEIHPMISRNLVEYIQVFGENDEKTISEAHAIAKKVIAQVDQNSNDPLKEGIDLILALGWTRHSVSVGVRKRGDDDYVVTIVNGGNGVHFHPKGDPSYNPLFILSGRKEQVLEVLASCFLLRASSYFKTKKKIKAEAFYEVVKKNNLKEEKNSNQPRMRIQKLGNCGIHNMRELIFYNIQRQEARFAYQKQLQISTQFPTSVANKFQDFIYRTGDLNLKNNSYLPENAKKNHLKKDPLPGIYYF